MLYLLKPHKTISITVHMRVFGQLVAIYFMPCNDITVSVESGKYNLNFHKYTCMTLRLASSGEQESIYLAELKNICIYDIRAQLSV